MFLQIICLNKFNQIINLKKLTSQKITFKFQKFKNIIKYIHIYINLN